MVGLCKPAHIVQAADPVPVHVRVYLQKDATIVKFRYQGGLVDGLSAHAHVDGSEEGLRILAMKADTSMSVKSINTERRVGPVDTERIQAEPDPVSTEGVIRPRRNEILDILSFDLRLALNRCGDMPGRVLPELGDLETANRRTPLGGNATDRGRVRANDLPPLEVEDHPLRQVDDDAVFKSLGDDVTIVDLQGVAGGQWRFALESVFRRHHRRAQAKPRAELDEVVTALEGILKPVAHQFV